MSQAVVGEKPRRFNPPRVATQRSSTLLDPSGRALVNIAQGALRRAPQVIARCTSASHSPVERRSTVEIYERATRIWRLANDAREQYCILDGDSERTLFGGIVGATLARDLSPLERNIVAEGLRQLLLPEPEAGMEELSRGPDGGWIADAWCCELNLRTTSVECATVFLIAPREPQPDATASNRPDLAGVALQLRATIPGIACQLGEIAQWRHGALLPLKRSERELGITVYAGRRRVAAAHLGVVQGRRAVRLVRVFETGP